MLYYKHFKTLKFIYIISLLFIIDYTNISLAKNNSDHYQQLKVNLEIIGSNNINNQELKKLTNIIKPALLITQASLEKKLTEDRIQNLHLRTEQEILESLQSLGYYHSEIISQSLKTEQTQQWLASYKVLLGDPIKIRSIEIKLISEVPEFINKKIHLLVNENLKINQQLNHDLYEKTKHLILNTLRDHGFLSSYIQDAKVLIDLKEYTAKISIFIDPKKQYYFGEVKFKSDEYKESFLNKYIPFKKMDLYSNAALMQFKNNLLNSDLFKKVRIDTIDVSKLDDNKVPILARVYAKPANKYLASIGFGTDSGFRGKLGHIHRYYTKPGHMLSINLAITKPRKQVMLDYKLPGTDPLTQQYNYGFIAQEEKIKNRFNRNLETYWLKTLSQDFKLDLWKISFLYENFKELKNSDKQNAHFILPSIKSTWYYPNQHNIDLNNKFSIDLKFSLKPMLSSANLLQLIIREKLIYNLGSDVRFIFKAQGGSTIIKNLHQLPISLRFFAGGDNSIRGFSYNNLGPVAKDRNGEYGVIGGKHLLFTSLQLEKLLPNHKELALAAFIDAGNAVNNLNHFISKQLAMGSGFGISYDTPVGTFKAYIAKPVKIPKFNYNYKKHLRVHLTFINDL